MKFGKHNVLLAVCLAGLLGAGAARAESDEVFAGLGGMAGIQRLVHGFLPLVTADPRISAGFQDVDLQRLERKLTEQFCAVAGGPCTYTGKDMKTIHEDLRITNAQFNALAEDLQLAMERQGIPARIQNKLIARLAPMQRDVVTR